MTTTIEEFQGDAINDELLQAASILFSNNYGVWGPLAESKMGPFAKEGRRVRMSAARVREQCLPQGCRNVLVRSKVDDKLAGHVFASRWIWEGRQMCWITQLCVDRNYREKGLATMMLMELREGEMDHGFGILSSHPGAILAALHAFGRGPCEVTHAMAKEHARRIMSTSPVEYVRSAVPRGSLFEDDADEGVVSCADTNFYVDHAEPVEALDRIINEGRTWPYGTTLPEGHEFLVMSEGRGLPAA
ncbi:Hypothetical protein D9617_20g027260 [Elsinoe fawcettii]|nr:Hypothetical protein D9617_20g027260 [Elsinoe fawcettii]